mmetsp:Transcript_28285/g.27222  ORF Transcript_28285/g.27222 Transcript_28285/m.27222 type:complete len:188 (+) Transcript_28285:635-1198(+)
MQKNNEEVERTLTEMVRSNNLKEIQYLETKLKEQGKQLERNNSVYGAKLMYEAKAKAAQRRNQMTSKDPLLNKGFGFYSSYIVLEMKDKEKLVSMDALKRLKVIIEHQELQLQLNQVEISTSKKLFEEAILSIEQKDERVQTLEEQLRTTTEELKAQKEQEQKRLDDFMKDISKQRLQEQQKFNNFK